MSFRARIKIPVVEIKQRLRAAGRSLETERQQLHEALGVRVLSFAKQDYVTKSRGGTGTDGIKWSPLKPATIAAKNRRAGSRGKRKTTKSGKARPGATSSAIGINTGLQLNSASPGFTSAGGGNVLRPDQLGVTVGFGRSYSHYFDAKRPLLPTRIPALWRKSLNDILRRWAERILGRAL